MTLKGLGTVSTLLAVESSGRSRAMLSWPGTQHGATLVNACINDLEIIILGEDMFICEMHPSFLRSRANFVAVFNETLVRLLFVCSPCFGQRIMILANV